MTTTEPIRDKAELNELADYWLRRGSVRNYALIVVGTYTVLRPCDLLELKWEDVFNKERNVFKLRIIVLEKKTGKRKSIALNEQVIKALQLLKEAENRCTGYIFLSNRKDGKAISRVQAWRIVKATAEATQATGHIALYSLRKTLGYHAWKAGVSPVVLMDIYNHSSYEITKRYLGVSQDDRDSVYLDMSLF